ncbi:MAG TPA: hypothetical protein VI111_07315, partial [Thermoleophilaceae bacterium]
MASEERPGGILSGGDLTELISLLDGADSVELKLTVPESEQRSAVEALGIDPLGAQVRLVYFFDTPDLTLNRSGVVVRARRVQGKDEDCVVKLRPVVPDELSPQLRSTPGFGVEVDAMPGGYDCSGTLKRTKPSLGIEAAVSGERPLSKVFGKQQRALFAEHAPQGVELDELTMLGPIFVLKLKSFVPGAERKLVVELWLYPDGTRILELSTKCPPAQAFDTAARSRALLSERGISITGAQQTKTHRALEFFARAARGRT